MTAPTHSIPPEIVNALRSGNTIEAIRLLRKSGLGLAEIKGMVETFAGETAAGAAAAAAAKASTKTTKAVVKAAVPARPSRPRYSNLSPGEMPRAGGNGPAAVLILIAAAILGWLWVN